MLKRVTAAPAVLPAAPVGAVAADGSFEGYASLFGRVDLGRDRVLPGAFSRSLRERGAAGLRLLWQHDPAEPIGVWLEAAEDARGLHVRGRLEPGVRRGREALALLRAGALDGLSIGFRTARSRTDPRTGVRDLVEIDLWEVSLVTFPMLPEARVAIVLGDRKADPLAARMRAAAGLMRAATARLHAVTQPVS